MSKVLIIEDDTILRENTAELLELAGYEPLTAPNGKRGVETAKKELPHLIICDIMMPELDGYGVLDMLSKDRKTRQIPFIFLSAKTEHKDIRKGMDLGADDYLTKPFEEQDLIGAIKSRLARVALLNEVAENNGNAAVQSNIGMYSIDDLKNFIDDNGKEQEYKAGETIYKEGGNSSMIFLVLKGNVKTHKLDEQGRELIIGIYRPDDIFGFTCFTKNLPYQEFATAMEDTKLAGIARDELETMLSENHRLTLELMQFLTENLSDTKEQLLQMAYASVRKKTAGTLLRFSEKLPKDPHGRLHILRSDLASVAGMATETLIRTLSSFKKEGLIRIEDRNIQILDIEALRRMY
jgi:CRP-like cAMP-binding protein/CheY-like chemotaxis protein